MDLHIAPLSEENNNNQTDIALKVQLKKLKTTTKTAEHVREDQVNLFFISIRNDFYVILFIQKYQIGLSLSDESSYELEKQKRFSNNICIMNATSCNPELDDPYTLFGKICNEIGVYIEADDIVNAYRTNTNGLIIVQLSSANIKRHILQSSSQITIYTNKLFDVLPPIVPLKVRIINFATPYFISMMHLAKQFQNRGIIRSYHMELNGLLIKKHTASKGKIFISKIVLTNYLEKRERKKAAKGNIA